MKQTDKIKEKITNTNQSLTQQSFEGMKSNQIMELFDKYKPLISQVLPKHLSPERVLNIAMNNIARNPKLAQCTIQSVIGGIVLSSILGLELIPQLGTAYLVPFKNSKTGKLEAVFMMGYKGARDLAYRTDKISIIYAVPVFSNDHFEYQEGLERYIKHIPNLENPGQFKLVYAICKFKDGSTHFTIKTKDQIETVRKRSKAGNDPNSPWNNGIPDDYLEMAKKTAIKALIKDLPISFDYKFVSMDNQVVDISKFSKDQSGEYDYNDIEEEIIEDNKNYVMNKVEEAKVVEEPKTKQPEVNKDSEDDFVAEVKKVLAKQIQEECRKTNQAKIKFSQILKDFQVNSLLELMNKIDEKELQSVVDVLKLTNAEVESNENEGK